MEKVYPISMLIVLFLCVSPNWAGTKYSCEVPLSSSEIIEAVNSTQAVNIYDNKYRIIIYAIPSINGTDVYTSITGSQVYSYVSNGLKEVYGKIGETNYSYAASLSSSQPTTATRSAVWDFVFFDPRLGSDLHKRNFAMNISCEMSTFNHNQPWVYEGVLMDNIVQTHNNFSKLKDNFEKLYNIYDDPEATKTREQNLDLIEKCKPNFYHVLTAWAFVATSVAVATCAYYMK